MIVDKITKAKCQLIVKEPWYGHFAMQMTWREDNGLLKSPTMGVYVDGCGNIICLYDKKFVESLQSDELITLIQHEIEHIVRLHCARGKTYDSHTFNIACDMAVNGKRKSPKIGQKEHFYEDKILGKGVFVPEKWDPNLTAEQYYEMLPKQPSLKGLGNPSDDHSIWTKTQLSQDEMRQVVKAAVDQASMKSQGNIPNGLKQAITELSKPLVNWRQLLYQYIGRYVGNKRLTFSRRNRRRQTFGIPGISHHAASTITVVVDTSGSISKEDLQQFFGEIDHISAKSRVFVLQWDSALQGYNVYKRGDWRKIQVRGGGGTDMEAPIQWLIDNRKVTDVVIMLTDGYCSYANSVRFPVITIVTDKQGQLPTYGLSLCIAKNA